MKPLNSLNASICLIAILAANSQGTETINKPLFKLKTAELTAKKGDFVLCPSRQFYDAALKKGVDKTTFIYYAATLLEVGAKQSTVKSLSGSEYSLPNQLIVSIRSGQKAKVGDILLTWWQSGSGMQRAIVVGGTETEPIVRYLDIKLDSPSGAGKKDDKLKPNSFYVLSKPWQIGSTLRIKDAKRPKVQLYGKLLAMDKQSVLVQGWGGKLSLHARAKAHPVPIVPSLKPHDAIQVSLFGSFKPATVIHVDEKIGRVFAKYQLGRTDKEASFAFGDVYAESVVPR